MAIKDKFSTPANEAAGIISELSIDHDIQEEFPALASPSVTDDENLSMSEYASAAGIAAGQPIKFSDMFGLSNFDKFYLKPGYKKQYYKLNSGWAFSPSVSEQYGFGINSMKNNYIHFPYVQERDYTNTELSFGKVNATVNAIGANFTNIKIPGYSRCDIRILDHAQELDDDHVPIVYTEGYPDIRLDIQSYDEYPRYTYAARDKNPELYDPHWNWMKITGKWVNRSSGNLDSTPSSFYFWRGGSECKITSFSPNANIQSYSQKDDQNHGVDLVTANVPGVYNPKTNKIFESVMPNGILQPAGVLGGPKRVYWDKPTTMEEVADNLLNYLAIPDNQKASLWGTRYADSDSRRDFGFNPAAFHNNGLNGASGMKGYRWVVPQDGRNNFSAMYGNGTNKFSDVRFSTNAEHVGNEYTVEFLVTHDRPEYANAPDAGEYFTYA